MHIVLTSSFPVAGNDAVFESLKAIHENPRIAWVPPGADSTGKFFRAASVAFESHGFTRAQPITLDDLGGVPRLYEAFDFIYLTGGNPIVFRDNAQRTGLSDRLREFLDRDGVVIGASGGAMLLTRNVALFKLEGGTVADAVAAHTELSALALVEYELLPHANRFDAALLKNLGGYARQVGSDVLALDDGAALIHTSATEFVPLGTVGRYSGVSPR